MNQAIIAKYEGQRVPRYTSYPTAPHFSDAVGPAGYRSWLQALAPDARLSLYLHVPFCRSMCWYCGCHTKIVQHDAPILSYVEVIEREIDMIADLLPGPMAVGHIHWGGGTPTIVTADAFRRVMTLIRRRFAVENTAEIAAEIDPRRLAPSMVDALAEAGINRASLGVQSFDPAVQQAVNRIQSFDQTQGTVEALRTAGVKAINFDLLYGLPYQTVRSCMETVDQAVALAPDRFAVFGYAHVPWMKRHQRLIPEAALPDGRARLEQFQAIAERLAGAGYEPIGLDHFATSSDDLVRSFKAGTLRRNFQGYTSDACEALIGFGASAIGALPQGYVQNDPAIGNHGRAIVEGNLATVRGRAITDEDRLRRDVIERIMCYGEVDLAAVAGRHEFDVDVFADAFGALRSLEADGIAWIDGTRIGVKPAYRQLVRTVAAAFDAYLQPGAVRHAKAV